MAWRTIKSDSYTSLEWNYGEGYYAFIYASPESGPCSHDIFLNKELSRSEELYGMVKEAVEATVAIQNKLKE